MTITIDGVTYPNATVSLSITTNQTPVNPPPVDPPPVQPPANSGGDAVWPLMENTVWPVPAFVGTGDFGFSLRFVADAVKYPLGIQAKYIDQSGPGIVKEYEVSDLPHDFSLRLGSKARVSGVPSRGDHYFRFGPATKPYDVALIPGGTYFINFREYIDPNNVHSRGPVQSQFDLAKRTS